MTRTRSSSGSSAIQEPAAARQYAIAKLLADARARFPYEFVIMLGDNMYGGESPADFVNKFEKPYKPILDAGIKFYATLGNHDESSQRFYKPFNMDGKRYYTFKKDDVEFFVLDSTYMQPVQVEWLKDALTKSSAKWKIAYFHHPLYSSGKKHGSEEDMRQILEPLFVQHKVNVVFAGHEHFYERIKPQKGIYYFTAGGSAKLRSGNISSTIDDHREGIRHRQFLHAGRDHQGRDAFRHHLPQGPDRRRRRDPSSRVAARNERTTASLR